METAELNKFDEILAAAIKELIQKRPSKPIDHFIHYLLKQIPEELQAKDQTLKAFMDAYKEDTLAKPENTQNETNIAEILRAHREKECLEEEKPMEEEKKEALNMEEEKKEVTQEDVVHVIPLDVQKREIGKVCEDDIVMPPSYELKVVVQLENGEKLEIETEGAKLVESIRSVIEAKTGIPAKSQKIVQESTKAVLEDGHKLKAYNMQDGEILLLQKEGGFNIVVRREDKTEIKLEVFADNTIDVVKSIISEQEGVEKENIRLRFEGEELGDGSKTIEECNIPNNSILELVMQ